MKAKPLGLHVRKLSLKERKGASKGCTGSKFGVLVLLESWISLINIH